MDEKDAALKALQEELDKKVAILNATPVPEMDNLSPSDMRHILHNTFGDHSAVGFKKIISNKVLEQVPFLKLVEVYLNGLKDKKEVKLTARGNLPRKLCLELYFKGIIKEDLIEKGFTKLNKEADSIVLKNLKNICNLAGLTKKRNNRLSLTTKGKSMIVPAKKSELLKLLFETHCKRFNLGYHDLYPQDAGIQATFGYTLYLLLQYGKKERDLQFYVDKNLLAFPTLLDNFPESWSSPEKQYFHCYGTRIFDRFLTHYGIVEYTVLDRYKPTGKNELKVSRIFNQVFELRKEKFQFIKTENIA